MKTEDELLEAIHNVAEEAHKSGFSFCAAIAAPFPKPVTTFFCGQSIMLLGLTEVIKANVFEKNETTKIYNIWPT